MPRPLLSTLLIALLLLPSAAFAQTVRYFGVWSYNQNAPTRELAAERLPDRTLGYWSLEIDEQGGVVRGTFHGSDGTAWLSFWYHELDGRVYADLYTGGEPTDAAFISRKSTQLDDRIPELPATAR